MIIHGKNIVFLTVEKSPIMSTRNISLFLCLCIFVSCKKVVNTPNQSTHVVSEPQEEPGKATTSAVYNLTGNRLLKGIHVEYWSAPYNINDTTTADTMTYSFVVLNDSTIRYGNRVLGWIGEMRKKVPYNPPFPNCVYYEPLYHPHRSMYYDTLQNKVVRYWDALAGNSGGISKAFIDILHE